jgi:hypothetical protein
MTSQPVFESLRSVLIVGCILFVAYRWRIVNASASRRQIFFVMGAIIIVALAVTPFQERPR